MSSFNSAPGDGAGGQDSRNASLSASSQASCSDLRRTSRLSSTAGIFDLDDDGSIDGGSFSSGGGGSASGSGRRASNTRVSSLGSGSHRGSLAERGSRNLFDVQEEDANPSGVSSPPPASNSSSSSKAAARSQRSVETFGKWIISCPSSLAAIVIMQDGAAACERSVPLGRTWRKRRGSDQVSVGRGSKTQPARLALALSLLRHFGDGIHLSTVTGY